MTLFWITLVPFAALFVLLIPFRRPAWQAAPIAYAFTIVIALLVWEISGDVLAASILNALIVFLELMLIVVFALLVLNIMIETGALDTIRRAIGGITSDMRVLAMLLAWGLVGFIEGIAGFGTPAVIAAPVLVYFGLSPLKAVAICLIGNSTAVPFGAAGTPVVIGLAGLDLTEATISDAVFYAALVHTPMSIFITCFIVYIVTLDGPKGSFRAFVPFAVFSALSFSLPYLAIAWFVGPELPAIIGGIVSLSAIARAARRGFLLPSMTEVERVSEADNRRRDSDADRESVSLHAMLRGFAPFIVMSLALIVSRTVPGMREMLQDVTITFGAFGGTELENLTPLYTPYFYLALALLTALAVFRVDRRVLRQAATATYERIRTASIVLIFIIGLTQLLLISDTNPAGLPSIPKVLGEGFADLLGGTFVVFSGFLGALGSFMTGSATVSNLLFGSLQVDAARALESPAAIFLALQLIGAGVGNMISLSNIAMAAGAAGLDSREGEVIRETIVPVIVVCLVAGLVLYFR
ncbi:MAG TPA: L-lactate permease [Saliniramus sp.]|nr:L-lactate permease [Saliniramus sp.]